MGTGRWNTAEKLYRLALLAITIALASLALSCSAKSAAPSAPPVVEGSVVKLPEPRYDSDVSLEQSLLARRSVRSYTGQSLTLEEISQLLWAAQGITDLAGFRTAPSAGGLYPLEIYVVAGEVENLAPGIYRYQPEGHQIVKTIDGDKRAALARAALGQSPVKDGAAVFVFTAVYERTTVKYGDRGIRYVDMEAGHAAQNLCLQAVAMELGAGTIGAFSDEDVFSLLSLPEQESPLYIIPVGRQ